MLAKVFIIFLIQIKNTIQENYDDDINMAYPSPQAYRAYSKDQMRIIDLKNNCSCKELAEVDVHCYGKHCQTVPIMVNSSIKRLKLKLTSIEAIEKNSFETMKTLVSLELNANAQLTRIESGCFANMYSLKNLTIIANVNLKHLDQNVFEGLTNVEQMIFQKNGFSNILDITSTLSAAIVPNLIFLDISESMFEKIMADDFNSMNGTKLKELNLILCEIEYINPICLRPLKNLSILRLGQNIFNLTMLTNMILQCVDYSIPLTYLSLFDIGLRKIVPIQLMEAIGATNISNLSLAHNHFDTINDNSFPTMSSLIELDLRNNFIVDISENAFQHLNALKVLHLGENKLIGIPDGVAKLQLNYLDLAGNTLDGAYFNIQESIFSNMTSLKNLQLAYNYLNYIQSYMFLGLANLFKLNLKGTSIQFIEPGSFRTVPNLKQLNLMNNFFTSSVSFILPSDVFDGLVNLQVLLLGGCPIKNLTQEPSIFSYVPNLVYLGLERTEIHVILPGQLTLLNSLKTLNLAENLLATWSKPILPASTKCLYCQQNKISFVTEAMLTDMQHLEYLYLDGNPFSCDCSLYSILTWLEKHQVSLINDESNHSDFIARCLSPEEWRQKSIVTFLKNLAQDPSECISKYNVYNDVLIVVVVILCSVICMSFCLICRKNDKK